MAFKPNETAATTLGSDCGSTETLHTYDIFRAGDSQWHNYETGEKMDGTGTKDSPGDDTVYIYASTDASVLTDTNVYQRVTLESPLVIEQNVKTTTVFEPDYRDKIYDDNGTTDGGHCWMAQGGIEFKEI
jgi:hypothetical protein